MERELTATCPEELKEVAQAELEALGAVDVRQVYKAVRFKVPDDKTFYRIHLRARSISSIMWQIANVRGRDEEELQKRCAEIDWPSFFKVDRTFKVDGVPAGRGRGVMSSNAISKAVRLGIEASFSKVGANIPRVELREPKVVVVAYLIKDHCLISLNTAGKSLHKRGYRTEGHEAPIKETLAAAMLTLAEYKPREGEVLFDPMCGSGTIIIEAASMALNKATNIHRAKGDFGFEWLNMFDNSIWRSVQDEERLEKADVTAPIFASDISVRALSHAKENAKRARVERFIKWDSGSFENKKKPAEKGLLISNLPYGERLVADNHDSIKDLYQDFGRWLKFSFSGWRAALLVGADSPYHALGLKPKRKINLLNGSIPVKLLMFDLYDGSRYKKDSPPLN